MENRAYTFVFLGVLVIVCLGAYVAVSALIDSSGEPIIRLGETLTPTSAAFASRNTTPVFGTRTPTPTHTPFIPFIPTLIFATVTPTPLPPTNTPTLPPFPSPRPIATRTPTPTPTEAAPPTPVAPPPPPPPTSTPTQPPGSYPYRVDSGPTLDSTRQCTSQYIIFGAVRDGRGQGLPNVLIRYVLKFPFPKELQDKTRSTPAGYYELTVGTSANEFDLTIVDSENRPQSPSIHVKTDGFDSGNCWYKLDWRRN